MPLAIIRAFQFSRGNSSAGRASRWQREGQGFESPLLHDPTDVPPDGTRHRTAARPHLELVRQRGAMAATQPQTSLPSLLFRFLLLAVIVAPGIARAQNAPAAPTPETPKGPTAVYLTIFSSGTGPDELGVAYEGAVTKVEIQQDFAALQRALGVPEQAPEVSTKDGIGGGKANLTGLTNWQTGEVNLAALAQAFRRFGTIRVFAGFSGNFPAKQVTEIPSPKSRVLTQVGGNIVSYEIVVLDPTGKSDATGFLGLPPGKSGRPWLLPALIVLFVGLIAGLVVYLVLSRKRPEPPQGKL